MFRPSVLLPILLVLISSAAAAAQSLPSTCAKLSRAEIDALVSKNNPSRPAGCAVSCSGCGCKGGPGYRNKKGKCVSYKSLIADCGPPPHAECTRECFLAVKGCKKPSPPPKPPPPSS